MKKRNFIGVFLAALFALSGAAYSPTAALPLAASASAASKLPAPDSVTAAVSGTSVKLKWSKVNGADAYRVYRYNESTGKYETAKNTSKTAVTFKGLGYGTYRYRIAALVKKNGKYTVQTKSSAVTASVKEENMTDRITVNTQSSIRIDTGDLIIRIDPFRITGEPHDADIVLITHEHYDHFSPDDLKKVSKEGTVYAAPASMRRALADEGITDAVLLEPDAATDIIGIPVETVRAYNLTKSFHPKKNNWLGYIVTVNGNRIYAAGDTDATPDAKAVKCDIALVPIGGTYTMDAKEAAGLINAIKPSAAIPIHYGSIVGSKSDADKFSKLVDSSIKVVIK